MPRAEFHGLGPLLKNVFLSGWAKTKLGPDVESTKSRQGTSSLGSGSTKGPVHFCIWIWCYIFSFFERLSKPMRPVLEPAQMLNFRPMSTEDWLGQWKITRPLLPIWKHSKAAPEPLGWRECPWPFPPVGHFREHSAMMVMFSCKLTGSLQGWAQAGAYINICPFQIRALGSTAADACPSKLRPPEFHSPLLCTSVITTHPPTSSRVLDLSSVPLSS